MCSQFIILWICASALSCCSITLGGFGADRFYLGQWREGLGKLFSFGGLGIWTLIDVLLIGVGYVGPADGSLYIWSSAPLGKVAVCNPFRLTLLCSQKIEDLRCRVLSTFACPAHRHVLIPSAKEQEVFSPSSQRWFCLQNQHAQFQSLCIRVLLRLGRWVCAGGRRAAVYVHPVGLT